MVPSRYDREASLVILLKFMTEVATSWYSPSCWKPRYAARAYLFTVSCGLVSSSSHSLLLPRHAIVTLQLSVVMQRLPQQTETGSAWDAGVMTVPYIPRCSPLAASTKRSTVFQISTSAQL